MAEARGFRVERIVSDGKDYPAAHSSDTQWYCVDECGHVASCWSSESGAIPADAATDGAFDVESPAEEEDVEERTFMQNVSRMHINDLLKTFGGMHWHDGREESAWRLDAMPVIHILSTLPGPMERRVLSMNGEPEDPRFVDAVLRHLNAPSVIQADLFDNRYEAKSEPGVTLLWLTRSSEELLSIYRQLHADGLCLACKTSWSLMARRLGKHKPMPVISYKHPTSNGAAWPYLRTFMPDKPPVIDELGFDAQAVQAVKRVVVEGCFMRQLFWQPADGIDCEIYDDTEVIKVGSDDWKAMINGVWGYWR